MSKKVYFTQEQLNHIMGEDVMNGGGYLDKTSMGSEYPTDSIPATDSEVIMTEPGGDSRPTDTYSHQKIANNMWLRRGNYSLYENDKKKDSEKEIDENWKGALLGTAMGAATLFGGGQAKAQNNPNVNQLDTIGYNIRYANGEEKQVWRNDFTPDEWNFHKKGFNKQLNRKMLTPQELKKLCPAAYKDRNNPNVWKNNPNKYVFKNPDGTINMEGRIAASRGQNPWEAIVGGERTVEPVTHEPIRVDADTMIKESPTKINKHLNERNAELDGKDLYTLPQEVRAFAMPDGVHDDIMARIKSGEPMNLASLYRLRNELQNSSNDKIKNAIDSTIKRAQMQGSVLRDTHANNQVNFNPSQNTMPQKGHRKEGNTKIYYEKD